MDEDYSALIRVHVTRSTDTHTHTLCDIRREISSNNKLDRKFTHSRISYYYYFPSCFRIWETISNTNETDARFGELVCSFLFSLRTIIPKRRTFWCFFFSPSRWRSRAESVLMCACVFTQDLSARIRIHARDRDSHEQPNVRQQFFLVVCSPDRTSNISVGQCVCLLYVRNTRPLYYIERSSFIRIICIRKRAKKKREKWFLLCDQWKIA